MILSCEENQEKVHITRLGMRQEKGCDNENGNGSGPDLVRKVERPRPQRSYEISERTLTEIRVEDSK